MPPRTLSLAVLATVALGLPVHAGIRSGAELPLQNADFASLAGWSQSASDGGTHFTSSPSPDGATPTALVDLPAGTSATLSQALGVSPLGPIEATGPLELGPKLELGALVWLPSTGSHPANGTLSVELVADDVGAIARATVVPASMPRDRWTWIATAPIGAGRTSPMTTQVTARLVVATSGAVYVDRVRAGYHDFARFPLVDGGFETPGDPSWETFVGVADVSDPSTQPDAYYGDRCLELGGAGRALVLQRVPLGASPDGPRPFQTVEAGAWVHVETSGAPNGSNAFQLSVRSWIQGTPVQSSQLLVNARWVPDPSEFDRWIWVPTDPSPNVTVPADATHLLVVLQKPWAGDVRVDGVELGEADAVHGHPARLALANYVGRYRSPLWPPAPTIPSSAQQTWRGWRWTAPPVCASTDQWAHDPDCTLDPTGCFRPNGRRNVAVTTEASLDRLPLAGAYDSRDSDVLRYHVEAARAVGFDAFVYDWLGHALAVQQVAAGIEPLNDSGLDRLFDVAEEPGQDLKLAVMVEPKVWFQDWVTGAPSFADKVAGITGDLVHLADTYGPRKAALRSDGDLVVFVFRHRQCLTGGPCLEDADWIGILDAVESATGERLRLVGDTVPPGTDFQDDASWYPSFAGMLHWQLLDLPFLRYRTFDDASNGVPSLPPAAIADVDQHARALNRRADQWDRQDDGGRIAVGIAWPGFDDTGVAGWSQTNFAGTDGQPLCVRVADELGGAFFPASAQAAIASRPDWLQVLTWNDWNEDTAIEPAWNAAWQAAVLSGASPNPASVDAVFERAFEAQAAVAAFKGSAAGAPAPTAIQSATTRYVQAARYVPNVVEYD